MIQAFTPRHSKQQTRMADAKEVGMRDPAEETCCHPSRGDCSASAAPDNVDYVYTKGGQISNCFQALTRTQTGQPHF
jgi:hypothetical protein